MTTQMNLSPPRRRSDCCRSPYGRTTMEATMNKLRFVAPALLTLGSVACATSSLSPEAAGVKVTSAAADVSGCKLLGTVTSVPPYITPNDGVSQLRNNAAALGADNLLLTSHGVTRGNTGSAYRCKAHPLSE